MARDTAPYITGNTLREARMERGYTQAELAEIAGLHVRSIENLEKRRDDPIPSTSRYAAARAAKALNLRDPQLCQPYARTGAGTSRGSKRAVALAEREQLAKLRRTAEMDRHIRAATRAARQEELENRRSQPTPVCGARTRKGTPCQCKKLLRGGKCKFHGGMSTGARTPEGIAALRQAGVNTMRLRAAAKLLGCRVAELTMEQRAAALGNEGVRPHVPTSLRGRRHSLGPKATP